MNDQFIEQFKLLKRAKKLEEMNNMDRALDLYIELHEKYDPNTSDAYERPAILFERKKRYQEALDMCYAAIEEIENDRVSGTVDKFQKRIDSIKEKMKDAPESKEVIDKYHFGIIGFRKKKTISMIIASITYILLILLGIFVSPYISITVIGILYSAVFLYDLSQKQTKKIKYILIVLLILSLIILSVGALNLPRTVKEIQLESKEGSLEGGENIFKDNDDMPLITEIHINDAIEIIKIEVEVTDALILVNGDTIAFGLELYPGTDQEKAIELSEKFVKALAHRVANDANIKAPSFSSLGELYDYYSILISAGVDAETIIAKGKKNINEKFINWYE